MTKAATDDRSYSQRIADAQADDSRDKTATGGESLVMSDATNESLKQYDVQTRPEAYMSPLREDAVLPGGEKNSGSLKEVVTEVVDADHAATDKAETQPTQPAGANTRPKATSARK